MQAVMTDGEQRRFAAYLDHLRRRGRKDATLDSYADAHAGFCRFVWNAENKPADFGKVCGADLRAWKSEMLKVGRAPTTINHRLLSIQTYAAWALRSGEATAAQVESIDAVPHVETPELGAVTLEADAYRRFLRSVELSRSRRDQAVVCLLLNGLRIGEVANLKMADVKLTPNRGLVEIRGEHVKRSAHRLVPLTARARHYLRAYVEQEKPVDQVFAGQRGPLTVSGIDKIVRGIGEAVGVEVHAHVLRHQFSDNYLAENPGDLSGLSKLLGHASVDTTLKHYDRKRLRDLELGISKIQT